MDKVKLGYQTDAIVCKACGKDLMHAPHMSMVLLPQDREKQIIAVQPCCKGVCDKTLSHEIRALHKGAVVTCGWRELTDLLNPTLFIENTLCVMNALQKQKGFANEKAYREYKLLLLQVYPYIARDSSVEALQAAQWHIELGWL